MQLQSLLILSLPLLATASVSGNSFPGHNETPEKRSLSQIYAAAKKESGTLRVSMGGDEKGSGDGIISAFKERFPDVKLNLTVDLSKYHDSRADRAFAVSGGSTDGTDVAVLQTVHDFVRWKHEGRLLNYKPVAWDSVYPTFKDAEGSFTGYFIYSFGSIIYNNSTLTASQVPSSYADFVKPEWKNKLVLTLPNDDDAVAYLFSQIVQKHGWSWLEDLAQNNVTWVRGSATPASFLAKSEGDLAVSFTTSLRGGAPLAQKEPSDPYMSWPQTGAIFKTTKMPETAKLFLSYMLSDEWQESLAAGGMQLTRKGIKGASDIWTGGSNLTEPMGFVRWMGDRENVEWWKLQFETTFGTAQGISPLDDDL